MWFLNLKLKKQFCIVTLLENKKNFQYKLCFKKKLSFLNLKNTPSISLTNRLMKRGNFLKIYKVLKKFYYKYLLQEKFSSISQASNYMFFYKKYHSFRDFDRVLLWKYTTLDCMFSVKTRKKIGKNKKTSINYLFIQGLKRLLLCINLIKYTILMNVRRKNKNINYKLFNPLYQFLTTDKSNSVIKLKYKIYKQKLMGMQN